MELDVHAFSKQGHDAARARREPPSGKVPRFNFSKDMYVQRQAIDRDFGVSFEPSEVIFEEGAPGKHMYIIQEGKVEVFRIVLGKKKSLSVLGPGDVFGEMSLLVNQTRTATVRALTQVRAYAFDRSSFEQMVHQNYGVAIKIIRMLAMRLQEADVHIENLLYQDNESKLLNTIIRAVEDEGIKTKDGFLLRLTPGAACHPDRPAGGRTETAAGQDHARRGHILQGRPVQNSRTWRNLKNSSNTLKPRKNTKAGKIPLL